MTDGKSRAAGGLDVCSCFPNIAAHGGGMSLNRSEQRVFDYLQRHPDERHHWQGKFQQILRDVGDERLAVDFVEPQLWKYYLERSSAVKSFQEAAAIEGLARTSMKNLAELLLRLWCDPRPKKKPADGAP